MSHRGQLGHLFISETEFVPRLGVPVVNEQMRLLNRARQQRDAAAAAVIELPGQRPARGLDSVLAQPLGVGAWGMAALLAADLTPIAATMTTVGVALSVGAVAAALGNLQRAHRDQILTVITHALSPEIGSGPMVRVRVRSWTSARQGVPKRITIIYTPQAPSSDPLWIGRIEAILAKRLEARYTAVDHLPLSRCLVLQLAAHEEGEVGKDVPVPAMAQRAEEIISSKLGSEARTSCTWDGEDLVGIDVHYSKGVDIAINPAARARLEKAVSTMLPGRWRSRWTFEEDHVRFEWRPEIPADLDRDLSDPRGTERERVLEYGVDEDGRTCSWDLRSSAGTPHFMCTGSTGAGKTALMRTLTTEICRRDWKLRVCDPKRVEFVGLKAWPNVEIVATTVEAMVVTIHQTYAEMERRYAAIEHGEAVEGEFEPLFLLLDEFRYFFSKVNAWYAAVKPTGGSKQCPILDEVFQIAILGRTADVHLILGTQRPDASWLGGDMRDQFGARASLGRLSPDGAKMMWDSYRTGTAVPRRRPGRGTAVGVDDVPVEMQSYWTPNPSKANESELELLEQLRPSEALWPRYVVLPLDDVDDAGEPIPLKGRYQEFLQAPYELASDHPELEGYMPDPLATWATGEDSDLEEAHTGQDEVEEGDLGYGDVLVIGAGSLHEHYGWLIEVEEGRWGVIESAERDASDEDSIAVLWRGDDSEDCGLLLVYDDERVRVRAPFVDAAGGDE